MAPRAVLFDFCASRGGEHPYRMLEGFKGTLVTDDFSGYHALLRQEGITGALCMAHARRKLFEAHKLNGSQIAGVAVKLIAKLYEIEREAHALEPQARWQLRQSQAKPVAQALHAWLLAQRKMLAKSDLTAKAIDYSLSNWTGLVRYLRIPVNVTDDSGIVTGDSGERDRWRFRHRDRHSGQRDRARCCAR